MPTMGPYPNPHLSLVPIFALFFAPTLAHITTLTLTLTLTLILARTLTPPLTQTRSGCGAWNPGGGAHATRLHGCGPGGASGGPGSGLHRLCCGALASRAASGESSSGG